MLQLLQLLLANPIATGAVAVVAALSVATCVQTSRLESCEEDHEAYVRDMELVAAKANDAAREREQQLQKVADERRLEYEQIAARNKQLEATVVRLRVDRDSLHNDLTRFAAGSPAADTIAACRDRAERLASALAEGAGLLAEGVELVREAAFDADTRGAKLSACIKAWPTQEKQK